MTIERLAGVVLLTGSLLFIVAAFLPISWVFGERDPEKKLEMINAALGSWKFAQVLFGAGAAAASTGLLFVYLHLRNSEANTAVLIAFVCSAVGAVLRAWHTYLRAVDPNEFVYRLLQPNWLAGAYFVLTMAALFALGIGLLKTEYQPWVGWMNIIASIVFILIAIIFGDIPPFVFYIITAITAVVLIL
jgi:hypothetical protein